MNHYAVDDPAIDLRQLSLIEQLLPPHLVWLMQPILQWLFDESVSDIAFNQSSLIWVKRCGAWQSYGFEAGTIAWATSFIYTLAAHVGHCLSRNNLCLSTCFAQKYRMMALLPPVVESPIFCIRIRRAQVSWQAVSASMTNISVKASSNLVPSATPQPDCWQARCLNKLLRGDNMLISGASGAGKTCFLSALLGELPPTERIILIEDHPEVSMTDAANVICLNTTSGRVQANATDLFKISLRLSADRIVFGEIRGGEAFDFLQACLSGHKGCLATIHSDQCEQVVHRFTLLCSQHSACALARQDCEVLMRQCIAQHVHIAYRDGARVIQDDTLSLV